MMHNFSQPYYNWHAPAWVFTFNQHDITAAILAAMDALEPQVYQDCDYTFANVMLNKICIDMGPRLL